MSISAAAKQIDLAKRRAAVRTYNLRTRLPILDSLVNELEELNIHGAETVEPMLQGRITQAVIDLEKLDSSKLRTPVDWLDVVFEAESKVLRSRR